MSVNVFLDRNKLEKKKGFKFVGGKGYTRYILEGTPVNEIGISGNRFYIMLGGLTYPIPNELLDCVEEITLHDSFANQSTRITGVYRYEDATAELDMKSTEEYFLRAWGKTLKNIYQLYLDIRAGKAFPETRWDQPQITEKPAVKPKIKKNVSIVKETDLSKKMFL